MSTIYFDMDGTIVDLYNVDNWIEKLNVEDISPYEVAKPLIDVEEFSDILIKLKDRGYKIGIITWGSKYSTKKFLDEVKIAKKCWLLKHLPKIDFDEFVVTDYSRNKALSIKDPFGILFDDDELIRKSWPGLSYPPKCVFPILHKLLKEVDGFEGV